MIVLGFDPSMGTMVAMTTALAEVKTVSGAVSCNVNWLVTVRFMLASLDWSAALCAVMVTIEAAGKT